jgi:endonuclease III-like uncharacterized protein
MSVAKPLYYINKFRLACIVFSIKIIENLKEYNYKQSVFSKNNLLGLPGKGMGFLHRRYILDYVSLKILFVLAKYSYKKLF